MYNATTNFQQWVFVRSHKLVLKHTWYGLGKYSSSKEKTTTWKRSFGKVSMGLCKVFRKLFSVSGATCNGSCVSSDRKSHLYTLWNVKVFAAIISMWLFSVAKYETAKLKCQTTLFLKLNTDITPSCQLSCFISQNEYYGRCRKIENKWFLSLKAIFSCLVLPQNSRSQ